MPIISRRQFTAMLVTGTGLAACSTPQPRARFPELTYTHLGAFRLDVARIEVVSEYKAPMAPPNIEHEFPTTPENALRRWAQDRLQATGTPGRFARFVIQDAKIVDTPLPRTGGVRGAFTSDQTDRYDGTVAAALEIRQERANYRDGIASAWASRARTLREGITLNERDKLTFELIESLMSDINAELERQIRANLASFIR